MQLQLYGNKIWLFRKPIDFRRGIDGLCSFIVMDLKHKPQEGIFIFYNRHRDKIKCLSWHKNGYILLYKRLEKGRFSFIFNKESGAVEINAQELSWALAGLEWQRMREWRDLNYDQLQPYVRRQLSLPIHKWMTKFGGGNLPLEQGFYVIRFREFLHSCPYKIYFFGIFIRLAPLYFEV